MDTAICRKHAEKIVALVTAHFPQLQCDVDASPGPVDYTANFSVQPGLLFPVGIHLDGDVFGLYAGTSYHQDFFPASDMEVVAQVEVAHLVLVSPDRAWRKVYPVFSILTWSSETRLALAFCF